MTWKHFYLISSNFISSVSISGHSIGSNHHSSNWFVLHQPRHSRIAHKCGRHLVVEEFKSSQPWSLIVRTSLGEKSMIYLKWNGKNGNLTHWKHITLKILYKSCNVWYSLKFPILYKLRTTPSAVPYPTVASDPVLQWVRTFTLPSTVFLEVFKISSAPKSPMALFDSTSTRSKFTIQLIMLYDLRNGSFNIVEVEVHA